MNTITIPKKFTKQDDLVVIPRREYEALVAFKRWKEFSATKSQKSSLARAEKHLRIGRVLTYDELVRKLGVTN